MEANGKGAGPPGTVLRLSRDARCPGFQKDVNAPEKPTSREKDHRGPREKYKCEAIMCQRKLEQ